jgi:hypothetical protein
MINFDRINLYTLHREGLISREERDARLEEREFWGVRQTPEQGDDIFRASGARQSDDGEKGTGK